MKFTCMIVDDEPLARKLVVAHVSKIENMEVVGECNDAIVASNFLRTRSVDLIFLDIQMPELSGLEFLRSLKNPPSVILTTAFREYAPEAFELDVVDYLLKPISFERFNKAVNKFFDSRVKSGQGDQSLAGQFIYLKADKKMHKVMLADILYIESLDDYVKVHLTKSVLVTHENISSFESHLAHSLFVRIHRSFIISIQHVTTIASDGVEMGARHLPFGRAFKKSALAALSIKG